MVDGPVHVPGVREQQQPAAAHVLDQLGVARDVQARGVQFVEVVGDPADVGVGHALATHFHAVFVLQARFKHVELQHANDAADDAFHAEAGLAEDLHGAFLSQLMHALHELLALERVHLRDAREMLRRERGDGRELHVLSLAHRVADAEDAGVEQAHDVAGVGLVNRCAVVGHERGARC